ncbi:MAG: hypothetical protein K2F57_02840, partial [Candidatus Gastranaerophilales bacterium]|nr:hypothetical protein [Candidatus Gastranaerophilales bacterium]
MRGFESHHPPHKKADDFCYLLFYLYDEGENPFEGSNANELRAKVLSLEQAMLVKRKTEDPLNASEQDNPIIRPIFLNSRKESFFMHLIRMRTHFMCILKTVLGGSVFVIVRANSPKQSSFWELGSRVIISTSQNRQKVTFLALFYSNFALLLQAFAQYC